MKGLYIHLPFCKSKCAYCGFHSETDSTHLQTEYFQALVKDLHSRKETDYGTLYIGGGTPSAADRKLLSAFLENLKNFNFAESTIEANPESADEEFMHIVRGFGFTRLSLGCQSTSDEVLKKLTRIHSAHDIFRSCGLARKICPGTDLNLDLIYDIPEVPIETTYKSMQDIISLAPEHISAYSYSFDTDFLKGKEKDETDFLVVKDRLQEAGYQKYEISNFAKPGRESQHNINYWKLGVYDGLGASAWSLENLENKRILRGKPRTAEEYIKDPLSFAEEETSEYPQTVVESLVFGLRMTKGIDFDALCVNTDAQIKNSMYNALIRLEEKELVKWEGSRVLLSRDGELFLDYVQEYLWQLLP